MASEEDCRAALATLAERLARVDPETRAQHVLDRTLSCRIPDLDVIFTGRLHQEGLTDVTTEPSPKAQVRITVHSDDLIALVDGSLGLVHAWATGQFKIDAPLRDLLHIRSML
jgi:hypothetical protein